MLNKFFFTLFVCCLSYAAISSQDVKIRSGAVLLTPEQVDSLKKAEAAKYANAQPKQQIEDAGIVDYNNPQSFVSEGALGALYAAVTAILAYLGGLLPGLRNIQSNYIRSGTIIFALLAGVATFRYGALNTDYLNVLLSVVLPNFVITNGVWDFLDRLGIKNLVKWILARLGIQLPEPQPKKA